MARLYWAAAGLVAITAIGTGVVRRWQRVENVLDDHVVYVIGDLHGDAECAKYWVDRLDIIQTVEQQEEGDNPTKQLIWKQPNASLVFMGDYVDKGPYSYQTIQFVKSLTDAFPDRVTPLMGNHEMELLRDREPETQRKYIHLAYSAVHPQEYFNFLERPVDDKDYLVIDLLMNASLEIYAHRWHQSMLVTPEDVVWRGRHGVLELFEESLRPVIKERLKEYQTSYLKAFASNATLGQWVENLPVAHIENGVLFCHGGINNATVQLIQKLGGVQALNELVRNNTGDKKFRTFLKSPQGRVVDEMLFYRGNHKPGACKELEHMLKVLGVERLAVGHTPGKNVRSSCAGQFWALDSLLGRWIRTSGNYYCPVTKRSSQDGKFKCKDLVPTCLGQVVKITKTHGVQVIF